MTASPRPTPSQDGGGPPVAERRPHPTVLHGERRVDDYFWMRDLTDPAVRAYLEAENTHTEAVTAPTRALQQRLYDELLSRIQQTDLSVPYRQGDWRYYTRTEEGRQYPIYCRRRPTTDAPEQIVLDLNRLAEGHPFMALGVFAVSDDGRRLAYSTDATGFRVYDLAIRDLETGEDLPDRAHDVDSVAWAADGRTLFYVVKDSAKRPCRLFRHRLGETEDALAHEESDERFLLTITRSRSRAYLFLSSDSHTQSEIRFRRTDLADDWTLVAPRAPRHEYRIDHHGDRFYLLTNSEALNFRLVSTPVDDPQPSAWREELPHRADVMLEDLDCFARHLVVTEREDGLVRLRIVDLEAGAWHRIEFPEPVYTVTPAHNREYDALSFRYGYHSFTTPPSVYDYDMASRRPTLLKRTEVLGGYDPAGYASLRLHATAADGPRVPISLVHARSVAPDGSAPLLLYGYGAYGLPLSAGFNSNRFSLLDRGVVFAIAHVRGGGELGKAWHDHGRMGHKPNTFEDFIACAEHLIATGWTRPGRLAIQGGSAGGLLMGAVTQRRPELFSVVLSAVPFVDVLNTMSDASLPLTVGEYEEWGNPANRDEYQVMRSYCPYTNLAPGAYPTMLVRTSLHDSQVMFWEPAKYVARLRTLKTDDRPLLFKINMAAGHGGASGRYDFLREVAFEYAFLLTQLGIEPSVAPGA